VAESRRSVSSSNAGGKCGKSTRWASPVHPISGSPGGVTAAALLLAACSISTKQVCGKYVGAMSDRARQDEGAVEEATYLATEGERAQRALPAMTIRFTAQGAGTRSALSGSSGSRRE
jgi:hypothetical protein